MIITFISIRMSKYYGTACDIYAENGIKSVVTYKVNSAISKYLNNSSIDYGKIINIQRNQSDEITAMSIDTKTVNQISNDLSMEIANCINNIDSQFGVPLGNMLGYPYLAGKGPYMEVVISPVNYVNYKINSQLLGSGINQTLHRIKIDFQVELKGLVPFHETKNNLNFEVILAETLIIGKIPENMLSTLR